MSGTHSIARNATFLLTAGLLSKATRAIYIILLARQLGPELYGLFAYGQAWYLVFLPATMLGIAALLAKGIGPDRAASGPLLGQTLTLKLLAVISMTILCGALGWYLSPNPEMRHLSLIFAGNYSAQHRAKKA